MEVDPVQVTEDFLLQLTSCKRLNLIQEVNISDQMINDLDWSLMSKLTTLKTLNVSWNNIRKVPQSLNLRCLMALDVSDNELSSLEFVEQFPNLEELCIKGNPVESSSEQFIALECCPKLKVLDGQDMTATRCQMILVKNTIQKQLDAVWAEEYEDAFPDGIPHHQIHDIVNSLVNKVMERDTNTKTPVKSRDFLLQRLASEMVLQIGSGLYKSAKSHSSNVLKECNARQSPRKRQSPTKPQSPADALASSFKRLRSPPARFVHGTPAGHTTPTKHSVLQFTKIRSPSKESPGKSSRIIVKPVRRTPAKQHPDLEQPKTDKQQKEGSISLPAFPDYEPVHFIRCHSGDREAKKQKCGINDPRDEFTKVWSCAFEPHPRDKDGETGIVASCGGDMVCMIDCSTGRVMKRFRQEGEQFYAIAWTTLPIETSHQDQVVIRPTNILAVGGYNSHICLLHPDQFLCYKEWGNGVPNKSVRQGSYYISALVFHPDKPTWLFSGASDETVTLLDIGIPSGPKHHTDVRRLMVFNSTYNILNLVISTKTNHLVAGCDGGIVAWKIPDEEVSRSTSRRKVNVELVLPLEDAVIDGMTCVTEDILACKCVEDSCIYAWNLTEALSKSRQGLAKIKPLLTMEWKYTKEKFIQPGSKNGKMVCGDDEGNIWLYNLKSILKKKSQQISPEMYRPSRILLWPDCELNMKNTQEKEMTDVLDKPLPLIVNNVCISAQGDYIVGVTDNNLVCIWKDSLI